MDAHTLWTGIGWPLIRLVFFVSLGLFVALLIESLNWTHGVARVAGPLVRLARLKDLSGASFSLAFFSSMAANTMLAEGFDKGELSRRELVLSNLFNSLPTYFLHLPTMFFITLPFLGRSALVYVGLTLFAALLRTAFIVLLGRLTLPPLPEGCVVCRLEENKTRGWRQALELSWKRFQRRIRRILLFTVPIYVAIYFLHRHGLFDAMERYLADHLTFLSFLPAEAMGIVVLYLAAEFTASLATAGALAKAGQLAMPEIVVALLIGNILSTPMRAFRHQFPFYAGIFKPAMALRLIIHNQALRALSIAVVALAYGWIAL